jgi:hypothetical protein
VQVGRRIQIGFLVAIFGTLLSLTVMASRMVAEQRMMRDVWTMIYLQNQRHGELMLQKAEALRIAIPLTHEVAKCTP